MYHLSEAQIDFIYRDIRARGLQMESLQQDILDHVCCMIEQDLEENGDFEAYYAATIRRFYKDDLKEIEEETLFLLTNQNYYAMKKVMLISGGFSALVLSSGILFKFAHWPGAGVLLMTGILLFSLLFLPLVFVLKVREKEAAQNKFILGLGIVSAILFSLSTLFKVMHWPGANIMGLSAIGIMILLFLPVYFFTGIRNPETKMNAIVTSILIVAASGLLMSLVRSPGNSTFINKLDTAYFLRNEQILQNEQKQIVAATNETAEKAAFLSQSQVINQHCQELKSYLLEKETGYAILPADYENKQILLTEGRAREHFQDGSKGAEKLLALRREVEKYNQQNAGKSGFQPIPVTASILDQSEERTLAMLNGFTQIQLLVLQNEREMLAAN